MSAPFDYLLRKNTYGILYEGNYRGLVGSLINNLYQLLATGNTVNDVYATISFALSSLGVPSQLGEQDIKGLGLEILNPIVYTTDVNTTLIVRNDSYGLNKFYHDGNNVQQEASRYWIKVKNLKIMDENGTTKQTFISSETTFAPEQIREYAISGSYDADKTYTVQATYDIYYDDVLANNNTIASTKLVENLTNTTYLYVSSAKEPTQSLNDLTFSSSGSLATDDEGNFKGDTNSSSVVQNVKMTASTAYIVSAADAGSSYQVRFDNSSTSDVKNISRWYMAPDVGASYYKATYNSTTQKYTLASSLTNVTASNYNYAYAYTDEDGFLYNQEGEKLKQCLTYGAGYIIGAVTHIEEDEETGEDKTVYDAVLVNGRNTNVINLNLKYGTPARGVELSDPSSKTIPVAPDSTSTSAIGIQLIAKGSTEEGSYPVTLVAQVGTGTNYATVNGITIAFTGDHDALKNAVSAYINLLNDSTSGINDTAVLYDAYIAANTENATFNNLELFTTTDARAKALNDLMDAVAVNRADALAACIADFNALEEVNYYAISFDALDDYEEDKIEKLVTKTPVTEKNEKNEDVAVLDDNGEQVYTYASTAPSYQINEYVRQYNLYKSYLRARGTILDRIEEELSHATTVCDEYDELPANSSTWNDIDDFTATPTTAKRTYYDKEAEEWVSTNVDSYRYRYSTKSSDAKDDVQVYAITTSLADGADVKYGAVENGALVNKGEVQYSADSWNAYIDALGEVITSINNEESVAETYTATSHLVMAENNLEIEEPTDSITVSGTVVIATSATVADGESDLATENKAAYDIEIQLADGTVVGTINNNDGTFTVDVPTGTTELVIAGTNTKDRTVTLAGDEPITGAVIPVIVCDYNNKDGEINVWDKVEFNQALKGISTDTKFDLNRDGEFNVWDKVVFNTMVKASIDNDYEYPAKVLA